MDGGAKIGNLAEVKKKMGKDVGFGNMVGKSLYGDVGIHG